MFITINYLIIFLYSVSVNSLQNDGIRRISVEIDDKSNNSEDLSGNEKKYLKVEIKSSNENEIFQSSCSSDSSEYNKPTEPERRTEKHKTKQKSDKIPHGRILNSYEETRRSLEDSDKSSREKNVTKPQRNNIHHRKTKKKQYNNNLKTHNIYPEKMLRSYREENNRQEDKRENKVNRRREENGRRQNKNIYPEKIMSSNENNKFLLDAKIRTSTTTPYLDIVEIDMIEDEAETQTNKNKSDKQQESLQKNKDFRLPVSSRDDIITESDEIQIGSAVQSTQVPHFYIKNITHEKHIKIKNEDTVNSGCAWKKQWLRNAQMEDMEWERANRRSEFTQSEIVQASRNSTIEVSDREDQENIAAEEDDYEDNGTLVDYPYSVSIQRKGAHYASGALVGERWVLSTAAEFYNVRETIKLFRLRLGSVDCKKGGIVTPIKSIVIHPSFIPGRPSFDVSVLRMAEPVPLSSLVKPIGLSRVGGKVMSAKFLTTYWPRIVVKEVVLPPTAKERVKYNSMRVSTQKLVPQEQCNTQMASVNVTLDKSSLCLKPIEEHHSICMPDAGAPVVAVDGLWGITSGWISPLCPSEPLPTVFTRVSAPGLRTWIDSQMVL